MGRIGQRRRGLAAGIAAVAAVAALCLASPAVSQQEDDVAAFVAAVEELGCEIRSDAQAEEITLRTGLGHETMSAIIVLLMEDGRLELLDTMDGIRLTTPGCA